MNVNRSFLVARDDLHRSTCIDEPLGALADGEVLLKVDQFALTTNNITYAETGDRLGYWQFYPAPDGWGHIPVWGFADVIDSRHPQIVRGERVYGFLPMSTHAVLRPDRVNEASFIDASAHRQTLAPAYNQYLRVAGDAAYRAADEDLQALLRPVFMTSFLIDDFLADEAFFGASRVLLSSASSKTAIGLAHQLHRRGGVEVVGLTSPANRAFVTALGCYDRVLAYAEIAGLPTDRAVVYVDFAGSREIRSAIHRHLGDQLKYSCAVGLSHRDRPAPHEDMPGPRPVFFFAPDRLRKRARDWGRGGIDTRFADQWHAFVAMARGWLRVTRGAGPDAVRSSYEALLDGTVSPELGHVLTMSASG
jgi:hypothetical protein